jgi:hypothetical protein
MMLLANADGGDDGWGLMWWLLMIVFGIVGFYVHGQVGACTHSVELFLASQCFPIVANRDNAH